VTKSGHHLWQQAASFAARAHLGQVRKDGRTPYAAHPFRVAMAVRDIFRCDDPECLAAALLHDVIEDTTCDYDDIAEHFGPAVAAMVSALTKDMRLEESAREAEYDARLARADWRARLIKLADVLDNLADMINPRDPGARAKHIRRCDRAIALAEADAAAHPETARAIAAIRDALA
jgi:(p)ppGpp synthase/HD superfamily hydrolase